MSDPLQKVTSGQKFRPSAAVWNTFVDAARDYLQRQLNGGASAPSTGRTPGVVLVQNGTGADLDIFQVIGLEAPVFGPDDNLEEFQFRFAFSGVTPTADYVGCFGVLQEPLKAGAVGQVLVDGLTPVKVNILVEGDPRADVLAGDATQLQSGKAGGGPNPLGRVGHRHEMGHCAAEQRERRRHGLREGDEPQRAVVERHRPEPGLPWLAHRPLVR